jgi:hypothetical protein
MIRLFVCTMCTYYYDQVVCVYDVYNPVVQMFLLHGFAHMSNALRQCHRETSDIKGVQHVACVSVTQPGQLKPCTV